MIEDNAGDVFLVQRALKKGVVAHELTRFEDGEAALKAFAGQIEIRRPDLILLDLNLPRRDGREVLKALRENPTLAGTPVAVITSSFASRDRDEAMALGADRYIHKPSDLNAFLAAIISVVNELLARAPEPEPSV